MAASAKKKLTVVAKKGRYHHGDLKEALISAAHNLISERGVDGFTLTDASRAAGVSTAAPYRHFNDRDDLIDAVRARGFETLTQNMRRAYNLQVPGSISAIAALGKVYVQYAGEDPAMFQVMWGRRPDDNAESASSVAGNNCFAALMEAVQAFQERNGLKHVETIDIAVPLWTMVHGTASLMMQGGLSHVAPDMNINEMISRTTRSILVGLITDHGPNKNHPPSAAIKG